MPYTHILAATDFSEAGNHAVQCACEEATLHGAKLTVVHVLPHQPDVQVYFWQGDPEVRAGLRQSLIAFPRGFDPDTGRTLPMPPAPPPQTVTRDYDEEALEHLRALIPASFTGPWDTAVASGDPGRAIVHVAQEHGADLIVVGAQGPSALHHLVLGSVAEKVVRHASCPVLTIKTEMPTT